MKVVQVSAYRDYDGCQWDRLFSTPELAFSWLRSVEPDTFAGVDDVNVSWVSLDEPEVTNLKSLTVKFKWGVDSDEDSVTFFEWDAKEKEYVEVNLVKE